MADNANTKVIEFPVGDYPERLDVAYQAAMAARDDDTPQTMLEEHPFTVLKAEYDALREESKEASREAGTYVVLREVSRKDWRAIKAAHPPRTEGDPEAVKADRMTGMNSETAEDDLVHAALREPSDSSCAHDPREADKVCSSDNPCANRRRFDEWADNLGAGKFAAIAEQAFLLTVGARRDPKSLPASPTRKSD